MFPEPMNAAKSCVMNRCSGAYWTCEPRRLWSPCRPLSRDDQAAETFEALYRRTFPRVYGYVASLLRDRAAAEDVTALAFERAYRKRLSFRADPRQSRRPGCSASRATPPSTSCGGASAAPRWRSTPRTPRRARPTSTPSSLSGASPCAPRSRARCAGARPRRAQVRRRALQRRDRARAAHLGVERRHQASPCNREAEGGLR